MALDAGKFPQCGQKGSACRPVHLGHWCQRDGLEEDKSLWIYPTPDPVAEEVKHDPAVLAARLDEDLAQADWGKIDQAWQVALLRLATAKIHTANGSIVASPVGGQAEYRPPSPRDRRHEERLREEEAEAREERERAGSVLQKARKRHRAALVAARIAATERERGQ